MARCATPFDYWSNAFELGMLTAEAQAVIAMRLWGMGGLWSVTKSENARMVDEKRDAITRSMIDAGVAAATGKRPDQIMAAAVKPLRQKTRSNSKRLAKRGPKLR